MILTLLAQLSGCASAIWSPSIEQALVARRVTVAIRDVEDVAPLAEDEFVVVSGRLPTASDVTRVGPRGAEPIAALPALFPYDLAPSVIASGGRWWFARMGSQAMGGSVFFVAGGEQAQLKEVRLEQVPEVWLPIDAARPQGLLVFVDADQPIATAVDASGRLAVVGISKDDEIVAMIVDLDHPHAAECRVISAAGEVAATPPIGTPAVVWTGDRFIAAWIRDDGRVRATELHDLRVPSWVIDVGEDADVDWPLRQLMHQDAGAITFLWKDRSGDLVARRTPRDLKGYAAFMMLHRLVCAGSGHSIEGK